MLFTTFENKLTLKDVLARFGVVFDAKLEQSGVNWSAIDDPARRREGRLGGDMLISPETGVENLDAPLEVVDDVADASGARLGLDQPQDLESGRVGQGFESPEQALLAGAAQGLDRLKRAAALGTGSRSGCFGAHGNILTDIDSMSRIHRS